MFDWVNESHLRGLEIQRRVMLVALAEARAREIAAEHQAQPDDGHLEEDSDRA